MKKFLVVLDINGTLLRRVNDREELYAQYRAASKMHDGKCKRVYLYNRPGLKVLVEFLSSHDTSYVFWSTAMHKNMLHLVEHLERLGFKEHLACYSQADCKVGTLYREDVKAERWVKDLSVVAEKHGYDIKSCILVDDSPAKSVHDQNFVCCKSFNPLEADTGIVDICRALDRFVGCTEDCAFKISE
jgi:hypothetical protein